MAFSSKHSFTLIEILVGVAIMLIVGSLLLGLCGGMLGIRVGGYSEGFRDGTVYKLSKKGFVVSTYEGELALEGYARRGNPKAGQPSGNAWAFSVADEAIWQQLNALPPDQTVRLHYTEYWMNGYSATDYLVTRVEVQLPQ